MANCKWEEKQHKMCLGDTCARKLLSENNNMKQDLLDGVNLPDGYIIIPQSAWEEQMEIELERDKLLERLSLYQKAVNKIDDIFQYTKNISLTSQQVCKILDQLSDALALTQLPSKEEIEDEEVDLGECESFQDFNDKMNNN